MTAAVPAPLAHGVTPAIQADQCSRLTRIVMRILRRRVCETDQAALSVASEVVDGLIDEFAGDKLYIPVVDRRAGLTNHEAIEGSLRHRLSAEALQPGGLAPAAEVAAIAAAHGVSTRTVYRVLRGLRTGAAVWR